MAKATEPKEEEQVQEEEPAALVGSGTPSVKVRVNTGVFGLRVGDVTSLANNDEVQNNIRTGNLSLVEE